MGRTSLAVYAAAVRQPRTVIEVDTVAMALSLKDRLGQAIPGLGGVGIGVGGDDGPCDVHLEEFPRRATEIQLVLDAVSAWVDEVGHPGVTVRFQWEVSHSPEGQTRAAQPVLYWKYEDGPTDAGPHGSSKDVGPGWLQTQDARGDMMSEPLNNGEWVSRSWAHSLARANGWTISVDD